MRKVLSVFCLLLPSSLWAFSATQLVEDARSQIGVTKFYDPAYSQLAYPMGDVPMIKGVCTDVVVRALRQQNIDLQALIHTDMQKNFSLYPKKWGLKRPDANIDHRRVPNIATYFKRQGYEVKDTHFLAGDVVTWDLGKGLTHIGIVSDRQAADHTPLIIHNIGRGTQEENILNAYKITGHFRYQPEKK